jgi:predicted nucleic acid-binding protein
MIFVDSGGWFALVVPSDPSHSRVQTVVDNASDSLFTTDYIVDETLTLLRARGEYHRAIELGSHFFEGGLTTLHRITDAELLRAWQIFRDFSDKGWSFTDCTSKAVIEGHQIKTAIALDRHFQQFGTVRILPEL